MSDFGPVFDAALNLIPRTGASSFQIRYQDDEEPTVWVAVAGYIDKGNPRAGNPEKRADRELHEVAAALHPVKAVLRLCEQLVDGGMCTHCHRPTGLEADSIETMPLDEHICWYQFDPELATFRRGCEGSE